jgi:hypothetical protein
MAYRRLSKRFRVSSHPSAEVNDLVGTYDKLWSGLDFAGLASLWVRDVPAPIYLGEEYAEPVIGGDDLDRHWSRAAARIKAAAVNSVLHSTDIVDDRLVRAVLLSRWRLTGRESDIERHGASWITWMLVRRGERYLIFHHMEADVYLADNEGQ